MKLKISSVFNTFIHKKKVPSGWPIRYNQSLKQLTTGTKRVIFYDFLMIIFKQLNYAHFSMDELSNMRTLTTQLQEI